PDDPDRVLRATGLRPEGVRPVAWRPEETPGPSAAAAPGSMPDLRGDSAREAATTAARLGLIVELKGSGHVVTQAPEAGAEIEAGMTCVLQLGGAAPAGAAAR